MSVTHVVGVDPGLVHTGVVLLTFDSKQHVLEVDSEVVAGLDAPRIRQFCAATKPTIFIEGYRPRNKLNNDRRMQEGVALIHSAIGGRVLDNMGVKKIVRRPLMQACGVWTFSTKTHHDDLRSAARIALYGMLKDDNLNRVLSDFVRDLTQGRPWHVAS